MTSEVIEEIATELDVFLKDINKSDVHQDIDYELGFWDFAGEREYYETHHTFLNQNALFLLVTSISDDIKNVTEDTVLKSVGEYISFWFDTVHSCGNPKDLTPDGKLNPPIIVVCTGIDKWNCKDATELKTKEDEYKVKLIDNMTPIHGQHFREICFVTNKEPLKYKKGFEELRNLIFTYGKTLKTCNEKLPVKWILLERSLDVLKEGGLNVLSYAEIKKLSYKCSIESEDEIKRFLEYQHKVGNIIYFENVLECIILSQQWLANVFKCLVTNKVETKLKVREDWKELENTGELKDSLLKELFKKIPEINLSEYKPHILEILKAFHILAKPLEIEKYYMPCMVTKTTTLSDLFTMFAVKSDMCTPWLIFDFDFMPFSMFNYVLVYFLREYFVCKERSSNKSAIYHGKAVFYLDEAKGNQVFVCYVQNAIALQIWKRKEFKSKVTCIKLLIDLKTEMRKLTHTFATNNLSYAVKAKCSYGNIDTVKGRVALEDMCSSKGDEYYCEEHCSMHKMDELLKTWFESCQVCHKEPSVYCCNDCDSSMCKYCTHQHMESTDTSHNIVPHLEDIYTLYYNFKVEVKLITDIKMLDNSLLVIADWDGKQLLICHITEHHQQHTIPLPNFPYYIAVVDKNTVAVTLFSVTSVLIVDVRKRQVMKRIEVNVMCYGIMYKDNQLFLGCSDKTIKIMNMSGELTNAIRTDVVPMYICGGEALRFYYTDWNKLYCIDACGNTLFKFNDVSYPWAFTVDDKGHVLVICDKLKTKVRSITADGKQSHVIISQIPSSYWNPYICYDPLSKSVVIGRDKTVYIYK